MPAAWTGEIASAITGTAKMPSPPRPPLDMPVVITAITAHIQNTGSEISDNVIASIAVQDATFQTTKTSYGHIMKTLDLNADIGEAEDANGIAAERAILPNISSANIACGGHCGDAVSMRRTVKAAIHYGRMPI